MVERGLKVEAAYTKTNSGMMYKLNDFGQIRSDSVEWSSPADRVQSPLECYSSFGTQYLDLLAWVFKARALPANHRGPFSSG
jgi:hypothetical protein